MADIALRFEERIAFLVLDREAARNALSPALLSQLIAQCESLRARSDIAVVCLRGAGANFSAGADIKTFAETARTGQAAAVAEIGRRAALALAELPQISVAAIQGHCIGGGVVLAGACDIRLAAADAWFSIPELELGIPLAWGGMARLIALLGETVAVELVLSCRRFEAAEARAIGLVSGLLDGDFDTQLAQRLDALAARPLGVLRSTKQQLLDIRAGTYDARADADALVQAIDDPESQRAAMAYMMRKSRRSSKP